MAMIQLPRNKTNIEAMGEAVNNLMGTIIQLKMMQGQRMINEAAQGAIAQGGGMNEIVNAVSQVKQKPQSSGLFNKIFDTFNPNKPIFTGTSDTENMISSYGIRNAVLPQGQNFTAAPWYNSPQWKDTPEGQAAAKKALETNAVKPLDVLDIGRYRDIMDETLNSAKRTRPFAYNYPAEKVNKAFESLKKTLNYDAFPDEHKRQFNSIWQERLSTLGDEVDPSLLATEGNSQDIGNSGQGTGGGSIMVKAPDGTLGTIPASEWEEAQKQGYVRIQ